MAEPDEEWEAFRQEIQRAANEISIDARLQTPDYIIADYCIHAIKMMRNFEQAKVTHKHVWEPDQ